MSPVLPGPIDRDGDGCLDACIAPCETACDCYRNHELQVEEPCPLLCPICGNYWACEKGECVEHCGMTPPLVCE